MQIAFVILFLSKLIRCLILPLALIGFSAANAGSFQQAIMEIVVNGHSEGQQFLSFSDENDIVLDKKLLESLRIKGQYLATIEGKKVHLKDLPDLKFKINEEHDSLLLTIPAEWFEEQTITQDEDLKSFSLTKKIVQQQPVSGYVNYQLQSSFSDTNGFESVNLPLDIGINWGQWFAFSSVSANYDNTSSNGINLHRQFTNLTWDDIPNFRSLIIGDIIPPAQPLLSSPTIGGISWGTKFYLDRKFKPYPDLDVEVIIDSASHAELLSNGQKVKEWDLSPGRVLFSDIGQYAGTESVLLLTDAYGNQRQLAIPAFTSNQLLKSGLHEYNYSLGLNKSAMGDWNYDRALFSGFHRYGFTHYFTSGLALSTSGKKTIISPSINTAIGENGKFNLAASVDADPAGTRFAGLINYQYRWNNFYGNASFNYFGRDYNSDLTRNTPEDLSDNAIPQRYLINTGIGYSDQKLGSLSVNYAETIEEQSDGHRFLSLAFQKQVATGLNLAVSTRNNLNDMSDYSVLFTVRYYPGESQRKFYDNLSYQLNKSGNQPFQHEVSLQKYNTRGIGLGYNISIKNENDSVYGDIRGQYNHDKGIVTSNYSISQLGDSRGGVALAGSLAFLDSGVYTGRPVNDSFAVVKVPGHKNTPVELYNTIAGYTNEDGELLVPELTSYMENIIKIPDGIIAINETMDSREQYVKMKQRGASKVTFNIIKFTAIEGTLSMLTADNKREELSSVPIEIVANGKKYESFVGNKGYFYIEGIPTGEHVLSVLLYKGNCTTKINITESDQIIQNLGALTCRR